MKAGFGVLRTPLLPFSEWLGWSEGLAAPAALAEGGDLEAALAADRALLRSRLAAATARPEVDEALFLASPSLHQSLEIWRREPESPRGRRAETSLVRYFGRMTARPTPFGLFAGLALIPADSAAPASRLRLDPRTAYRRHTRLDMDYLCALAAGLERDPALRRELRYGPNTSLHFAAGRWRYVEARLGDGLRSHHLVTVEANEFLDAALERAEGGAGLAEIAAAVAAADPDGEISQEDGEGFAAELIDRQLLVSDLEPAVTGAEPVEGLRRTLARGPAGAPTAARLAEVQQELERLDAGGLAPGPERLRTYRDIQESLSPLPAKPRLERLFQVDLSTSAAGSVLGGDVLAELARGAELLRRLGSSRSFDPLRGFRDAFVARWGEEREVPLVTALDEESGIGFEAGRGAHSEAAPLLQGIALPRAADAPQRWGKKEAWLLPRLEELWRRGGRELALSGEDLDALAWDDPAPLPDAFHVGATLAAASEAALAAGDFQLLLSNASGPPGARMIGRFCHGDPALQDAVEAHLRAEEALAPDAVFAELVHLPQGRVGNVLCRPVFRGAEIPFLGRSGAPPERQIPVQDLRVRVAGSRVELRSARLGRPVVPCLTNAHNFDALHTLGLYRFLCYVQRQHLAHGVLWSWGALAGSAGFLPRVRSGRLVLSRARWRVPAAELKPLGAARSAAERYRAVQRWRQERGLPRHLLLVESEHEIPLDLDNALSVESFVERLAAAPEAILAEPFPEPAGLCAHGPEGRFVHELVVPFVRTGDRPAAHPAPSTVVPPALERSFPPGSEWLYAKLYTGPAGADRVLREAVAPLAERSRREGWADGWFFLRYGDPDWHLRVRFHGDPRRLTGDLLPALREAAAPLQADGTVWKLQLDTYEREVERYGGPAGIPLAERIFAADSETVLEILALLEGDAGAEVRWQLALLGAERLLHDLGLDAETRLAVFRRLRDGMAAEAGGGKPLRLSLDRKLRGERERLERLLAPAGGGETLEAGRALFHRRTGRISPLAAELAALETRGELALPVATLAGSFAHMHVNRMIRAAARPHELVIYDFLTRIYESKRARGARDGMIDGKF